MPLIQKVNYQGSRYDLVDLTTIHPVGNKYFKLKYNLSRASELGYKQILSFGGAWSNHIHALSQIAPEQGFRTVAVIRGERPRVLNYALKEAEAGGVCLHFVSRSAYKLRTMPEYLESLRNLFGEFYLLPEGGTNELGIRGAAEIVELLQQQELEYDRVIVPLGSGGTMAGIASRLPEGKRVTGICVLKGAADIDESICERIPTQRNWNVDHEGHCGGYAKCPEYLKDFILDFEMQTGVPLEPVYVAKMLYRLHALLKAGAEYQGQKVVAIHTGGLQGRRGFNF